MLTLLASTGSDVVCPADTMERGNASIRALRSAPQSGSSPPLDRAQIAGCGSMRASMPPPP